MGTNHPEHKFWPSLCEALGRADLVNDARFASTQDRLTNSHALYAELDPIFATKSRSDWLAILSGHGLLFAPVNRPSDVLTDPQALGQRGLLQLGARSVNLRSKGVRRLRSRLGDDGVFDEVAGKPQVARRAQFLET